MLNRFFQDFGKVNLFAGQGKVRQFCNWSERYRKIRKNFKSQGKVRESENKGP